MSFARSTTLMICSLAAAMLRSSDADDDGNLLTMSEGAPYKIAFFADLHFGEDAWTKWGPQQDINSLRVMSNVLDAEKPDFVIYLGDVVTANNMMTKNASLYWDQASSPARARGIPWCTVFGNHDDAAFEWPIEWFSDAGIPPIYCPKTNRDGECSSCRGGTTRLELMRSETSKNPLLSYSRQGPSNLWPSVSNYVLKLSSSKRVVLHMYFFDSGGGSYPQVISDAQVKWFQKTSEEFNPESSIPEIVFWHIPSKEFEKVSPRGEFDKGGCVGSMFSEKVAPQEAEMGIMEALVRRSSVKALFVGHNHGLDWCCPYEKLWLCFGRHTGYGGYGNWSRGARIVEVDQQQISSIKSWIRMENGRIHSEVIILSP